MSASQHPSVTTLAADTMICPYCTERISAQAVVCRYCQRDLQFFAPVQRELRAQARRIDALEQQNAQLAKLLATHLSGMTPPAGDAAPGEALTGTASPVAEGVAMPDNPDEPPPMGAVAPRMGWAMGAARIALPVLALVLAHAVIVIGLDLHQVWLRVASIVLPLALGFAFAWHRPGRLPVQAACSVLVALLAVAAMAAVVARTDGVPFWPQDVREWREIAYYATSIAFSDLTGVSLAVLAHRMQARHAERNAERLTAQLAAIMGNTAGAAGAVAPTPTQRARRQAEAVRDLIALLTPIVTAVVSVVTGVVALFK